VPGDGTEDDSLRTATQQDRKVYAVTRCCRLIVNHRPVSSFTSTPEAVQRWQGLSGKPAVLDGDGRNFDELARERRREAA
jgi:hypothetical protein